MEDHRFDSQSGTQVIFSTGNLKIKWGYLYNLALSLAIFFNPMTCEALELENFGGWERDSQNQGFGFVSLGSVFVLNDRTAVLGRVMGSYLYYNFDSANGTTEVTSPGITLLSGGRFSREGMTAILLGGAELRRNRNVENFTSGLSSTHRETEFGGVAQGMVDTVLFSQTWLNLFINYGGANQYTFSRLAIKRQITNFSYAAPYTFFVGLEGIGQGNQDIIGAQGGGFLEVFFSPTRLSILFKGGYKHSWFPDAPEKDGTYLGVNFYTRLR
jgi:hypothetical protein